jgi:hypothetical protein
MRPAIKPTTIDAMMLNSIPLSHHDAELNARLRLRLRPRLRFSERLSGSSLSPHRRRGPLRSRRQIAP